MYVANSISVWQSLHYKTLVLLEQQILILKPELECYYNDKAIHMIKLRGRCEDVQKEKSSQNVNLHS